MVLSSKLWVLAVCNFFFPVFKLENWPLHVKNLFNFLFLWWEKDTANKGIRIEIQEIWIAHQQTTCFHKIYIICDLEKIGWVQILQSSNFHPQLHILLQKNKIKYHCQISKKTNLVKSNLLINNWKSYRIQCVEIPSINKMTPFLLKIRTLVI